MKLILALLFIFLSFGCGPVPVNNSSDSNSNKNSNSYKFCTDDTYDNICTNYVNATLAKKVQNINTKYGKKSLNIWVENELYDNGTITDNMLQRLTDIFLKDGANNDIYDWDTNIYGEEWGEDAQTIDNKLIAKTDTIDILIFDMPMYGVAGYSYPKDNYKKEYVPSSNEKIMFYINSNMYIINEKEVFTTLAHEFQHTINFYQRGIKKGIEDKPWLNEMLSETTEDVVATKIGYKGPRNVDPNRGDAGDSGNVAGRYPLFNEYNYYSLTNFSGAESYALVSSFGAFLVRNFAGVKLLHDIFYSDYSDESAVVDAVMKNNNLNLFQFDTNSNNITINQSNQITILRDIRGNKNITLNINGFKEIYVVVTSHNNNNYISINNSYSSLFKKFRQTQIDNIFTKIEHFRKKMLKKYSKKLHKVKNLRLSQSDIDKKFNAILNLWGVGVILSNIEFNYNEQKPKYNFGKFLYSNYGSITYNLGSINFFNYIPTPTFTNSGTIDKDANLYSYLGVKNGIYNLNVNIEKEGDIIIIAK